MKKLFNIDDVLLSDVRAVFAHSFPSIEFTDVGLVRYLMRLAAAGCIDFKSIDETKVIAYVSNSRSISKSA